MAAGGFKAYRHIASILRLMEYCEGQEADRPDYSQMSDEELLAKWANLTGDLLTDNAYMDQDNRTTT